MPSVARSLYFPRKSRNLDFHVNFLNFECWRLIQLKENTAWANGTHMQARLSLQATTLQPLTNIAL